MLSFLSYIFYTIYLLMFIGVSGMLAIGLPINHLTFWTSMGLIMGVSLVLHFFIEARRQQQNGGNYKQASDLPEGDLKKLVEVRKGMVQFNKEIQSARNDTIDKTDNFLSNNDPLQK